MGKIVLLSLAAALYPPVIAVVLLILTRPRPKRLLAFFYAGAFITETIGGFVVLVFLSKSGLVTESDHGLSPWVDLGIGIVSIGVAAIFGTAWGQAYRDRRKAAAAEKAEEGPQRDSFTTRMLTKDSAIAAFTIGVALDLPSVWFLSALNEVARSGWSTGADVAIVIGFVVVALAMVEIPLLLMTFSPERAERFVTKLNDALTAHGRRVGALIALAVGVLLIVTSIADLT